MQTAAAVISDDRLDGEGKDVAKFPFVQLWLKYCNIPPAQSYNNACYIHNLCCVFLWFSWFAQLPSTRSHTETRNRFTSSTHCFARSSAAGLLSPTWLLTRWCALIDFNVEVFSPPRNTSEKKENHSLHEKLVELTKVCLQALVSEKLFGPRVAGSVMSLQPCGLQLQEIPPQCCQPRGKYSSLVLTEGDPEHESPIVCFLPHSDRTLSMQRNHTHSHSHTKRVPWGINNSANW